MHISELQQGRVNKTTDVVNVGDSVKVKVLGFDDRGKVKLSMRVVDQADRRGHHRPGRRRRAAVTAGAKAGARAGVKAAATGASVATALSGPPSNKNARVAPGTRSGRHAALLQLESVAMFGC